jgi:hypothetical protein
MLFRHDGFAKFQLRQDAIEVKHDRNGMTFS